MARKVEKTLANTHGGLMGESLIERLETELLEAMIQFLSFKDNHETDWDDKVARTRGLLRGKVSAFVTAVAVMRNIYTADDRSVIKALEREFVKRARAEIETGIT